MATPAVVRRYHSRIGNDTASRLGEYRPVALTAADAPAPWSISHFILPATLRRVRCERVHLGNCSRIRADYLGTSAQVSMEFWISGWRLDRGMQNDNAQRRYISIVYCRMGPRRRPSATSSPFTIV